MPNTDPMHYTNEPGYDKSKAQEYEDENERLRELLIKKSEQNKK